MTEIIHAAIARFGTAVTVIHNGEAKKACGFIQPVTREGYSQTDMAGPLGAVDQRCWRYIGCAETPVEPGDTIRCGEERWHVHSAAAEKVGTEVSHYWAVLAREVNG